MTILDIQKHDDEHRAELASELVLRIRDESLATLEHLDQLKNLVTAFSVRHGQAVITAGHGLFDALEMLLPALEAVVANPESWDRHK